MSQRWHDNEDSFEAHLTVGSLQAALLHEVADHEEEEESMAEAVDNNNADEEEDKDDRVVAGRNLQHRGALIATASAIQRATTDVQIANNNKEEMMTASERPSDKQDPRETELSESGLQRCS